MRMKKVACLLLISACLIAATYQPRSIEQNWKFDSPATLDLLDPVSGKWEIVTPPKLNQPFLSQSVKYADFPKVLLKDKDYYDFDATVKLYVSSENQDTQAGGLVLRYRNLYSFYMLFLNTKDKRLTLTKASLGGMKVLKRVNQDFSPDRWYELKAHCYLDTVQAYVNGQLVLEAKDSTSTGGKVGLVTAGTSRVYFDDLHVNAQNFEVTK
jgi:Domain of Unknown Function (DUF1080).